MLALLMHLKQSIYMASFAGHIYTLFKARLDKVWQHQLVKFDFTADLTGTGNRSEEVIK